MIYLNKSGKIKYHSINHYGGGGFMGVESKGISYSETLILNKLRRDKREALITLIAKEYGTRSEEIKKRSSQFFKDTYQLFKNRYLD